MNDEGLARKVECLTGEQFIIYTYDTKEKYSFSLLHTYIRICIQCSYVTPGRLS